ncbi:MAG: NUDIX hydrolase [Candidatus Aminicenantes bacterium]|nr:NUDIX hydrolase [Candidatus Aminicenantes bacterium]
MTRPKRAVRENAWLGRAKRIMALAQTGLAYAANDYERDRYRELEAISLAMMADLTGSEVAAIGPFFEGNCGYQTPKVDVRAGVIREGKILLVREKADGRWAPPGGFADIGCSPARTAVKETREEAGLRVEPVRLIAVLDKALHPHPPSPYHIYKILFLCRERGGKLAPGWEVLDAAFFDPRKLPPLSKERITRRQIGLFFEYRKHPSEPPVFD